MPIYFGSNLKMYKGISDTLSYLKDLQNLTEDINETKIKLFIIPSYTSLKDSLNLIDPKKIKIGAQNVCWDNYGQFTGEISPTMLKELGVELVMIGHSERRHLFKETNIEENKKVLAALRNDMSVLLCVGESIEQKEYGIGREVLREQLIIGLHGVNANLLSKVLIAYEPVWSIGVNGIPATADYVEKMHLEIRFCLRELFGEQAEEIPILYGGSVNLTNCEELIFQPSVDGLFVGRAAWDANRFNELIRKSLTGLEKKNKTLLD